MKKLLTTPAGSILKVFISTALTALYVQYQDGTLCYELACIKTIGLAAVFATIPMIINYFNPTYTNYGVKQEE